MECLTQFLSIQNNLQHQLGLDSGFIGVWSLVQMTRIVNKIQRRFAAIEQRSLVLKGVFVDWKIIF